MAKAETQIMILKGRSLGPSTAGFPRVVLGADSVRLVGVPAAPVPKHRPEIAAPRDMALRPERTR